MPDMERTDYVSRIGSARVYDVARVTALDRARNAADSCISLFGALAISLSDSEFEPKLPTPPSSFTPSLV